MKMSPRFMTAFAMATTLSIAAHCIGADKENANEKSAVPPSEKSGVKHSLAYRLRLKPSTDPKTGEERAVDAAALAKATDVIGKRLSSAKLGSAMLTPQPPDSILLRAEGLTPEQVATIRECVMQTAMLDFRMVHGDYAALLPKIESKQVELDPAWILLPFDETNVDAAKRHKLIVQRIPEITGDGIAEAGAYNDNYGWLIKITFTKEAGEKFFEITKKMRVAIDRFAIVLNGKIVSAPTTQVAGGIAGGGCVISGKFTEQEAKNLAAALMNPLRNPIVIEEENVK